MTEVNNFNKNPPKNREEEINSSIKEANNNVIPTDNNFSKVDSNGETDSNVDKIRKDNNIENKGIKSSLNNEEQNYIGVRTRSNGNINLNQNNNTNSIISTTGNSNTNTINNINITNGTNKIDNNENKEYKENEENIKDELKTKIIIKNGIKNELEDNKDPLERDKRPIKRNLGDDEEEGKLKKRMLNNDMMLEARRDIKTEKFIKNLPEIEGISYDRTFKCFRSRVPPRFSRFPMEALFSRKRYGLKNAWLKAISHLFNNIAFLVFDYPRPSHLRQPTIITKNEKYENDIDKELINKYLSNGFSIKYEEYRKEYKQNIKEEYNKEKYQKTSDEETSEGDSSDYKIQDSEECLGLLSSTRCIKKNLPPDEEKNPKMIADSLKPWHESIFWIPSICRWRTMYHDENSVKHSKTFTPSVFGGVKQAYYAAIEFRKMIDNMDKLNQSAIRRRWVKNNYSLNVQNNNIMEETRKFIDIDGINKFNISIESRLPNNKENNTEYKIEHRDQNGENNSKNKEFNRNNNREYNIKKENDIIININKIDKRNYGDNVQYDAEFLSGLDKEGLYIPIPLDWKSN